MMTTTNTCSRKTDYIVKNAAFKKGAALTTEFRDVLIAVDAIVLGVPPRVKPTAINSLPG